MRRDSEGKGMGGPRQLAATTPHRADALQPAVAPDGTNDESHPPSITSSGGAAEEPRETVRALAVAGSAVGGPEFGCGPYRATQEPPDAGLRQRTNVEDGKDRISEVCAYGHPPLATHHPPATRHPPATQTPCTLPPPSPPPLTLLCTPPCARTCYPIRHVRYP